MKQLEDVLKQRRENIKLSPKKYGMNETRLRVNEINHVLKVIEEIEKNERN